MSSWQINPGRAAPSEIVATSPSAAAFERARRVIPGGSMRQATYFPPHPPYAASGEGCRVTDLEGRTVLDCANNFFSLIHGHAFPPVLAALTDAMARGTAFGLPTPLETELAEMIRSRAPRLEQVRFCNSGTEAVMFAVKAARALTGRDKVAKFEGAYHGAYDHMEVSLDSDPSNWGEAAPNAVPYVRGTPRAVLNDTVILPFNDAERCAAIIAAHGKDLACVVLDALASRLGMVRADPEFLAAQQGACRRHGVLLILDEVITFRLSHGGVQEAFSIEPDLTSLAKVIGGGLPVGAVAGKAELMAVFDHTKGKPAVAQGGTFAANPLTMAAGIAALRALDRAAIERLNRLGDRLRTRVNEALRGDGLPAQVTGWGSLFRLHLTARPIRDYRSCWLPPERKPLLAAVHGAMLARGVLMTPNCSAALSTPMGEAEIDTIAAHLVDAVQTIHRKNPWSESKQEA